jgi:hypothetical protein
MEDETTITIDVSSIDLGSSLIYSDINNDWLTISSSSFNPKEWEDKLPDLLKVEEMCKDYPALEKAYENFKTVYKMVEQDWIGRQKSEQQELL